MSTADATGRLTFTIFSTGSHLLSPACGCRRSPRDHHGLYVPLLVRRPLGRAVRAAAVERERLQARVAQPAPQLGRAVMALHVAALGEQRARPRRAAPGLERGGEQPGRLHAARLADRYVGVAPAGPGQPVAED